MGLVIAYRTASALLLALAVRSSTVFELASRICGTLSDTVIVFVADVVLESVVERVKGIEPSS
jgi:hypothetical protein